ncbi:hypothetical protein PSE_p0197 (plasmid) [Pseudovibrio sp. FO-BEG1]|nr:hypothetical protein [Pseudovibrio sp. FO-BEG1]AEV39779.1 hypothetical protein PSE_p0197 [Pseudovibrio sp. FO-BEG1]
MKGQLQTSETETQGFRVDVTQLSAFMLRVVLDERWFETAPFVGTR